LEQTNINLKAWHESREGSKDRMVLAEEKLQWKRVSCAKEAPVLVKVLAEEKLHWKSSYLMFQRY